MLNNQILTEKQISKANELIANLSTRRFESMVYQVDVYLKEVHRINFADEYDAMTFCERLAREDIPHSLQVINLKMRCYE